MDIDYLHIKTESNIEDNSSNKSPKWRGWLVAGLLYPWLRRLRVRPRPKWMDFHDAENRQRLCRMIIRHVKDP
ncbi:hypothetical protein TNCV_4146721 [Trichonephila clavipes]|nr:hypothetical protein TNCV_4146721 [Trichonephila clavipes]